MDRITPVKHANEGYLSKEIKAYTRHCSRVQPAGRPSGRLWTELPWSGQEFEGKYVAKCESS